MTARRSTAPSHLSESTRRWWKTVLADYDLDPHHLKLLQAAAEAWDRLQDARKAIGEHGTTYTDRFGAPRLRPECAIERDSRLAFARLIRELDLDVDPPSAGARPPALRSNRRRA
jgi:phage terminase small subunit